MPSPIFQNPKSGSIKLSGTYEIVDEQGNVLESVTDPKLCGCGLSQTKPICDNRTLTMLPMWFGFWKMPELLQKPSIRSAFGRFAHHGEGRILVDLEGFGRVDQKGDAHGHG